MPRRRAGADRGPVRILQNVARDDPHEITSVEREQSDNPLADGTGMDRPDEMPAMRPGDEESRRDEATGGEATAVEGAAGIAAAHRTFGGQMPGAIAGAGTHVPTDGDEHGATEAEDARDSTDPRGL